jgi:hypothetical protein
MLPSLTSLHLIYGFDERARRIVIAVLKTVRKRKAVK